MILRDQAAIEAWRWPHFVPSEFVCHCGCGTLLIDSEHLDKLERLRCKCGFPLKVTSGYRCPKHNVLVAHTGDAGPHTTGKATDFGVEREQSYLLVAFALQCDPLFRMPGVGIGQREGTARLVHLDSLTAADGFPRPMLCTY